MSHSYQKYILIFSSFPKEWPMDRYQEGREREHSNGYTDGKEEWHFRSMIIG